MTDDTDFTHGTLYVHKVAGKQADVFVRDLWACEYQHTARMRGMILVKITDGSFGPHVAEEPILTGFVEFPGLRIDKLNECIRQSWSKEFRESN